MQGLGRLVTSSRRRTRRALVLLRLRAVARMRGATVDVNVARDVKFGSRVRIGVARGSRTRLQIEPKSRILDDVLILLAGGSLYLGEGTEIRRGTVLTVSGGDVVLEGRNKLSYGNTVHCTSGITLEMYASTAESVSIIDSTHHHDGASDAFYENTSSSPILIGRNAWLCNKSSILMGITIGPNAVVASHAVVNKDVAAGTVVGGIPAVVIGQRSVSGPALEHYELSAVRHEAALPPQRNESARSL